MFSWVSISLKDGLGIASVLLSLFQYGPLIYLTYKGQKRPHFFTRLIWALMFGITFAAQYTEKGGAGSWATAFSCLCCLVIALVSLKGGLDYITRLDCFSLVVGLAAIALWGMTQSPLLAVLLATGADMVGYIPTFRKTWHAPQDEVASSFAFGTGKQLLSLAALEHYSLTTVLYPACVSVANILLVIVILGRQRQGSALPSQRG